MRGETSPALFVGPHCPGGYPPESQSSSLPVSYQPVTESLPTPPASASPVLARHVSAFGPPVRCSAPGRCNIPMQQSSHSVALPFSLCGLPCCSLVIFRLAVQTARPPPPAPPSFAQLQGCTGGIHPCSAVPCRTCVSCACSWPRCWPWGKTAGCPRKSNLPYVRSRPRCNRADPAACHRCCRSSRHSIQAGGTRNRNETR